MARSFSQGVVALGSDMAAPLVRKTKAYDPIGMTKLFRYKGQRTRTTIKWTGTVVTALLLILWVVSGWWYCQFNARDGSFMARVESGTFDVIWVRPPLGSSAAKNAGWHAGLNSKFEIWWWFVASLGDPALSYRVVKFFVPLWSIALVVALPTGWLWWRDRTSVRRRRLGQCIKCGYDLRGTQHEACPECGVKAAPLPETL